MTRQDAVHLALVLLAGCAFVFALEAPSRASDELSVTGGYAVAAGRLLPPRAQPSARNVHHSSPSVAT